MSAEMNPRTSAIRRSVETSCGSLSGVTICSIPSTLRSSRAASSAAGRGPPELGSTSSSTSGIGRTPVESRKSSYARELSEFGSWKPNGLTLS